MRETFGLERPAFPELVMAGMTCSLQPTGVADQEVDLNMCYKALRVLL